MLVTYPVSMFTTFTKYVYNINGMKKSNSFKPIRGSSLFCIKLNCQSMNFQNIVSSLWECLEATVVWHSELSDLLGSKKSVSVVQLYRQIVRDAIN